MEHREKVINSIFYESLEYIIAPLALIFLTHILLSAYDKDKLTTFRHYAYEYNIVSAFSNLLFYFSLNAHNSHAHSPSLKCACYQIQALLIFNFILFLLFFISHKFDESKKISQIKEFSFFKNAWIPATGVLFVLIIAINLHLNKCTFTSSKEDWHRTIVDTFNFLLMPAQGILIPFIIFGFWRIIVISSRSSQYGENTLSFQDLPSIKSSLSSESLNKEAEKENSKMEVRVQKYYYAAELALQKKETKNALTYINKSKQLAISIRYQENFLLPIRELKMRTHIELNEPRNAMNEILELKKKLETAKGTDKIILEYCIKKLTELISS